MKKFTFLVLLFLLPVNVLAESLDIQGFLDNPDELKETYNTNINHIPSFIKKLFGNERINVHLSQDNTEEKIIYLKTNKGTITNIKTERGEDPTLNIYISSETIETISNSKNPIQELRRALQTKEIRYEAVKLKTKMKLFFTNLALRFF